MVGYRERTEWNIGNTLPALLSHAGYETAWVGRSMHQYPAEKHFGFEHVVSMDHRCPGPYNAALLARHPDDWEGIYSAGIMHNDWTARPWHLEEDLHPTNWTIHEALRFIRERDTTRPFFLVVSFIASHPPLIPPAFYLDRYIRTGVPDPIVGDWAVPPPNGGKGMDVASANVNLRGEALLSARAGYYGLLNHLDDQLRRIINPVTGFDPGNREGTIAMLTSDHGEMLGDHYLWRKTVPYHGSIRIPLLVSAPPSFGLKRGAALPHPVGLEDVMPTCLDFAGVSIPDSVEGRSLLPLMRGENAAWREYIHIEHAPMHHTLCDGKEKFIWFAADGREQFFRLATDPNECHDLIRKPKEAKRIAHWRNLLIKELAGRPEGFTDGKRLIPGRPYRAVFQPEK
jgi:arylsulfatase A-like enzyme